MEFRTPFVGRKRVAIAFDPDSSLTQQNEAEFTTIKSYLDKYARVGVLGDPQRLTEAQFGDFVNAPDFQQSLEQVQRMTRFFEALPSDVRRQFHDDPAEFAAALGDPSTQELLRSKGILEEPSPAQPGGSNVAPQASQEKSDDVVVATTEAEPKA